MARGASGLDRVVNEHFAPYLRSRGFEIQYGDSTGAWREGAAFTKQNGEWTSLVLVSREKYGNHLAVNVLRTRGKGKPEPLALAVVGLSRDRLTYSNPDELRALLESVITVFESSVLRWLAGEET